MTDDNFRKALRDILLDSLEPNTIKWGHTLDTVTASPTGGYTLTFRNGRTSTTDLVIGADGTLTHAEYNVDARGHVARLRTELGA